MNIEEKYWKLYDAIIELAEKLQKEAHDCQSILDSRRKMGAMNVDANILGIMKAKVEDVDYLIDILNAYK